MPNLRRIKFSSKIFKKGLNKMPIFLYLLWTKIFSQKFSPKGANLPPCFLHLLREDFFCDLLIKNFLPKRVIDTPSFSPYLWRGNFFKKVGERGASFTPHFLHLLWGDITEKFFPARGSIKRLFFSIYYENPFKPKNHKENCPKHPKNSPDFLYLLREQKFLSEISSKGGSFTPWFSPYR